MSVQVQDLESRVLDRLEEDRDDPQFWTLTEVRQALAETFCEATLIAGEPEVRSIGVTLTAASTTQAMPAGALAITRVESSQGIVQKEFLYALDRMTPNWEIEEGAATIRRWFPLGLNLWGIYPRLQNPIQVIINYVAFPIADSWPFTGLEAVPFQNEYHDAFADLAAHILRFKEGNTDFAESIPQYDRFIFKMRELSKFASRKNVDRFALSGGAVAKVADVETR